VLLYVLEILVRHFIGTGVAEAVGKLFGPLFSAADGYVGITIIFEGTNKLSLVLSGNKNYMEMSMFKPKVVLRQLHILDSASGKLDAAKEEEEKTLTLVSSRQHRIFKLATVWLSAVVALLLLPFVYF